MTNYYEELELNQSLGLDELKRELAQMESVWRRREINAPEKAARKLILIAEAREAFRTAESRAAYDRELALSKQKPVEADPNAERKKQFDKWYQDALSYDANGENDLAKTAIEKAMGFCNMDQEDASFYNTASVIYRKNKDFSSALNYANKAIIIDPANPFYYLTKGLAYSWKYADNSGKRYSDAAELKQASSNARTAFQSALSKAQSRNDNLNRARALGLLAFTYYYQNPVDAAAAENYATEAVRLGDDWGNASNVLDTIAARRSEMQKQEEERLRRQKEEAENERIRREKAEQAERERKEKAAREKARKRTAHVFYVLSWICVLGSIAFFVKSVIDVDRGAGVFSFPMMTALIFGSVDFLNFMDEYVNGDSSGINTFVTAVLGITYIFTAATVLYTQMGFGEANAARTWKMFGIMMAAYVIMVIIMRVFGRKLHK